MSPVESFPSKALVRWFRNHRRDLPWRGDASPYEVWVAEVMLQQTRVSTVEQYYDEFLREFPTVEALAEAAQDEVLKAWEGMGFYARARRLHSASQTVIEEHDGEVPSDYQELKELSGIGDYTAAAIEAFAFNGERPVMDGNVHRVITRWAGIDTPIDRADTDARIRNVLEGALKKSENPGELSEGLMELGALICTPSNPDCENCPLFENCEAFQGNRVQQLPVTRESDEKPHHEIAVAVILENDDVLISRRPEEKMLGGLWEFPGGKLEDGETLREALCREMKEELGIEITVGAKITEVPHEYSHLSINLHAYFCNVEDGQPTSREGQKWKWVPRKDLEEYAFPKANKQVLEELMSDDPEPVPDD